MQASSTYRGNCTFTAAVSRRRGGGLANLIVCIVAGVLLFAVVAPALAQVQKERDNRLKCMQNLKQIGLSLFTYANSDANAKIGKKFPRLYFDPGLADKPAVYTGVEVKDSFGPNGAAANGPAANDVSGALFLLLKTTEIKADAFVCPSSDAAALKGDVLKMSNFAGRQNLSYSYSNPYPAKEAIMSGWRFDPTLGPDVPLAADMNPGETKDGGPTKVLPTDVLAKRVSANSPNHWYAGQNVVYCDGHVEWQTSPFCGAEGRAGAGRDNIYANRKGVEKDGRGGVINGPAQMFGDAVLLPTYQDGPQPKTPAPRTPDKAQLDPPPAK